MIKRYDTENKYQDAYLTPQESENGKWVKYEDHIVAMTTTCDKGNTIVAQLTSDKHELLSMLESIEFKCRVALDESGGLQAVRNLINKHKKEV